MFAALHRHPLGKPIFRDFIYRLLTGIPISVSKLSITMMRAGSGGSTGSNSGVLHQCVVGFCTILHTSLTLTTFPFLSTRIPSSPVKKASPAAETELIHLESDSDSESDDEIGEPSIPRTKKNKRLSVWSTTNETEVIAISSSSESDSASEEDESPSRPLPREAKGAPKPTGSRIAGPKSASTLRKVNTSPVKGRAPSKKRFRELLVDYARDLYTSLNINVFGSKLPPVKAGGASEDSNTCEIIWSNTLKKTAGRAVISRYEGISVRLA